MAAPHDDPGNWSDLVAHEAGRRITDAEPFADHLVLHEWMAAQPRVRVLRRDGSSAVLDFGDEPHDLSLGANPEWSATTLRLSYQSLTTPQSVFDHDLVTGDRVLRKQTPTPGVDLDAYVAVRTWATSPDGVAIPVDVVRHRDTPLDGTAPCVVYAYGAYEYSLAPWFSVARLSLLDRGVVFAARPPARRWRARPIVVSRRQVAEQAQHVRRHAVGQRPPRRRPASPTVHAWPYAAAAPEVCSSARASRCAPSAFSPPWPRCPSSTSSRR